MTIIRRNNPFGELLSLRQAIEHGLLRLSIPKAEEAQPRQIKISPLTDAKPSEVSAAAESSAQPEAHR